MSEPSTATPVDRSNPVRSGTSVFLIVAAIFALPLIILIGMLVFSRASDGAGAVEGGIDEARIQAVYMANDRVFFGNLEPADGDWLSLQDAFYLRRSAAEQGKDGQEAGSTDLVPLQQEVGGDGDMLLNSREVVLVQNLAKDSPIAQKIEDAIK